MSRYELRTFNGRFEQRGVIERIRRKIQGRLMQGCVILDFEEARLSQFHLTEICSGWPTDKVKCLGCRETALYSLPDGVMAYSATDGP